MVRLLQELEATIKAVDGCFNPTMVRLLPPRNQYWVSFRRVSIPQWCDCCTVLPLLGELRRQFQSHNGAIAAQLETEIG